MTKEERRIRAELVLSNFGQVVTLSGHSSEPCIHPSEDSLSVIQNSDSKRIVIASSEGRICYIGRESDIRQYVDTSSAIEVDCKQSLVTPGFVDSHTHAIFAGSREEELELKVKGVPYLEILKHGGGILKTVSQTRKASDEEIIEQTRRRLSRMLASGTTTFEVKSGYGLCVETETRLLEILSYLREVKGFDIESTLLSAHAIPEEYKDRRREYIKEVVRETIEIASKRRLATFCDVFLEKGVFEPEEAREILNFSTEKGLLPKVHADEFSDLGGSEFAARMNVVSADHLLYASRNGLEALAGRKIPCVLLPGTSLSSFVGLYANARELFDLGGVVALGTDLSPNSWIESMQFVISLACYGMRMTPAECLVAATVNSAHAIRRADDVGSLEVGKSLDAIVFDLENYREIPYRISSDCIKKVIKRGKVVIDRDLGTPSAGNHYS